MKLKSKLFSKDLVLGTNQMKAIKGGTMQWTQSGSNNAGTSSSTRDFWVDSGGEGSRCGVKDDFSNWHRC